MGMAMFFVAKSVFWLSVVALAMPGGDIEARKAGVAVASFARLAAPAAAMIADHPASAGAEAKCLAASQCRAALTQLGGGAPGGSLPNRRRCSASSSRSVL